MGLPDKSQNIIGLMGKDEAGYGAGGSLVASTDALQLWLEDRTGIPITPDYLHDGKVGPAPGSLGNLLRSAARGRFATLDAATFFRGGGAAYSASLKSSLHRFIAWCGHDWVGSFLGGSEKWTATPTLDTGTMASAVMEAYTRLEKYPMTGVVGNWRYEFSDRGFMKHTFELRGILGQVVDAAVPSLTYPTQTLAVPDVAGLVVILGNLTGAVVKRGSFNMNRKLQERTGANFSDLHGGFIQSGYDPMWELEIEQESFVGSPFTGASTIDPWRLFEAGTQFAFSVAQVAGGQYNRWTHAAVQAQIKAKPEVTSVNGVPCIKLQIEPKVSTAIANDSYSFTTD